MSGTKTTTKARKPTVSEADRPPYAALSFVRGKPTRYGWASTDLFAVPDEGFGDGYLTGLRAFQELQQFIKAQPQDAECMLASCVQWMFEEAFTAREAAKKARGKSKHGAAAAFTTCAGKFLLAMLKADTGRHMAETVAAHQGYVEKSRVRDTQERAAFTERMRVAKAAKRAAREAQASTSEHPHKTSDSAAAAVEVAA